MMLKKLWPGLVSIALLAGCATTDQASDPKRIASLDDSMAAAETALKAGQSDKAVNILQAAAKAYPTDKAPLVRVAQVYYDNDNYGQAIVFAQEALQRDADDTLAHSIVAVSGLRVASKAVADLTRTNNFSGTVRSEAQDLAKLLRTSLGEDVLVPPVRVAQPVQAPPKKKAAAQRTAKARKPAASADPFGALQ